MSRKEFEKKVKRLEMIQKKEASNGHWDAEYREELKKQKQKKNEKRYAVVIKFVIDEISKRPKHLLSKREITTVISSVFSKSKYMSDRFSRRRTRYL